MPNQYAILVCEDSLPLIEELNGGVRPKAEEDRTVFIHTTDPDGHNKIVDVEDFYREWPKVEAIGTDLMKL